MVGAGAPPQSNPNSPPTVPVPERPRLRPGVRLLGESSGSGFAEPQWLVERDGQFLQVPGLLYLVLQNITGNNSLDAIAVAVSAASGRLLTAEHIAHILRTKLLPLGLVDGGTGIARGRETSPLRLTLRKQVIGPGIIEPVTDWLRYLYAPPILIPLILAILAAHIWLYLIHGIGSVLAEVIATPTLMLIIVAITLVADLFHEFGHASALRYGGGNARGIGVGFYLIFPAYYTDVTDSYRLGRWARVRTDLGGFYFHLIATLAVTVVVWTTDQTFLLAVVLLIDLSIVRQFVPFARFDGYWAFADLTGIPDPLSQMGPFLRSLVDELLPPFDGPGPDPLSQIGPFIRSTLPKRFQEDAPPAPNPLSQIRPFLRGTLPQSFQSRTAPRLPRLKAWVTVAFAIYTLTTLPVLAFVLFLLVKGLPFTTALTVSSVLRQLQLLWQAESHGEHLVATLTIVQMLLLALPLFGVAYILYTTARLWLSRLWKWAWPGPARLGVAALLTGALVIGIAMSWVPQLSPSGESVREAAAVLVAVPAKPIDGIQCNSMEESIFHVHVHLSILDGGRTIPIPGGVGIKPNNGCLYWLHTHDTTGIIHVEAPRRVTLTLGNFFDIWGRSLGKQQVASARVAKGQTVRVYVNGKRYLGNPRGIPLTAHKVITIEIGPPFKQPVRFVFPTGL